MRFLQTENSMRHWAGVLAVLCLLTVRWAGPAGAQANVEGDIDDELAPYLREDRQIIIFDPDTEQRVRAIQQAAERLTREPAAVVRPSELQNILTFEFEIAGLNREEILREGAVRALKSTAAQLYFTDYILMGRDILEPYLRKNGIQFLARKTILAPPNYLAGGRMSMPLRLSVNLDTFYQDLREKHFIGKPNLRPVVSVHLAEFIDGQPDTSANGRQRIEQVLQNNLIRVNSKAMREPPLTADLTQSPELLKQARYEAQRNEVDVLVTGTMRVRPIGDTAILYDFYAYQEVEIDLMMYRVDNGELLNEIHQTYSAVDTQEELPSTLVIPQEPVLESARAAARDNALETLINRAAEVLADDLTQSWTKTMLDAGHYRLLIRNVPSEDSVQTINNLLRTLSPDVEVYRKAYYGDVLVLNVIYPLERDARFETFLREANEPQFNVTRVDSRHYILDVI